MSEPPRAAGEPPGSGRAGIAEWAVSALRSLTIQNILTLALLAAVGVPAYFAWRFMSDPAFRHEFMNTAVIVDAQVPCVVVVGNLNGRGDRYMIGNSYKIDDRFEYLVFIRSPGVLGDREIGEVCRKAHAETDMIIKTIAEQGQPK
jgi:hypothetical protein